LAFLFYCSLSACKQSAIKQSFSSTDSLVIHFKDEQAGTVTKTVQTSESNAINRMIDFIDAKETKEFKEYWTKALPKSAYYFIGVVPQDNLNIIEPLTISPKQDMTIRVSLYFEALKNPRAVTQPIIVTPTRNGFTVVEWGGMVKQDKDHPFTCNM